MSDNGKKRPFIVGLGHKARNGKDYSARYMKAYLEQRYGIRVETLHFADELYKELSNKERKFPLIKEVPEKQDCIAVFDGLDRTSGKAVYVILEKDERISALLSERGLPYWGMDEKDSPMLQWWGTDYRRRLYDKDYWIECLEDQIKSLPEEVDLVFIPDVRFKNEYDYVKNNGLYIEVIAVVETEDGRLERYIDPSRDPNHPSECDLDGVGADLVIAAKRGELEELKAVCENYADHIYKQFLSPTQQEAVA
jgi:hypothetical protein